MGKFEDMVRANVHYRFDPAWQNADGTPKKISRAGFKLLTPQQRDARQRAQSREYSRRRRARAKSLSIEEMRARSERLRSQRIADQAARDAKRKARAKAKLNKAFPAPPGATVDQEIRRRVALMNELGRRPSCGIF